jgi:hypothetical protein
MHSKKILAHCHCAHHKSDMYRHGNEPLTLLWKAMTRVVASRDFLLAWSLLPPLCKWRLSLFSDVTQRRVILSWRHFGTLETSVTTKQLCVTSEKSDDLMSREQVVSYGHHVDWNILGGGPLLLLFFCFSSSSFSRSSSLWHLTGLRLDSHSLLINPINHTQSLSFETWNLSHVMFESSVNKRRVHSEDRLLNDTVGNNHFLFRR